MHHELHGFQDKTSIRYFNTFKLYEQKIADTNALINLMNPGLLQMGLDAFDELPSYTRRGYTIDSLTRTLYHPNGTVIKYHLTGPATVTNSKSRSALTDGLISAVGSFTAVLTESGILTGVTITGFSLICYFWLGYKQKHLVDYWLLGGLSLTTASILYRYLLKPYWHGKPLREQFIADYRSLMNKITARKPKINSVLEEATLPPESLPMLAPAA